MKTFLLTLSLLVITAMAYATDFNVTNGNYASYPGQHYSQSIGPIGSKTQKLTVNNTAINLSNYILYDLVIPASLTTCQVRYSVTAPVTGYGTNTATVFPAAMVVQRSVNVTNPFANFSGCTNAYFEIQ